MTGDGPPRGRIIGIYAVLVAFNIAAWVWAFLSLKGNSVLLGTAFLAYSFGLRHALDADHIAAIDNVTRKLMQEKRRPVTVGLYFALGHSTVVILTCLLVAATASVFGGRFHALRQIGGVIGTLTSFAFLWLIGILNLLALRTSYAAFKRIRAGEPFQSEDLDGLLLAGGIGARTFRPLMRIMRHGWHMFLLGFLFGLGFETATEVMLLGLSAERASHGMSITSVLLFPTLFTAGMTLVDTTDGAVMMGVYGWALVQPLRKLHYNITVTLTSAAAAFLVGGVQALGFIADHFGLTGGIWSAVAALTRNFGALGYLLVGLFVGCWALSFGIYRLRGYDRIQVCQPVKP